MKKDKDKKKKEKIQFKDFVPEFANRKLRDQQILKQPEVQTSNYEKIDCPNKLFPLWKNEEFNFNEELFTDPENGTITIPSSLFKENSYVRWLRPSEYVKEKILENEITRLLPNKNPFTFKDKVWENYKLEYETKKEDKKSISDKSNLFDKKKQSSKSQISVKVPNKENPISPIAALKTEETIEHDLNILEVEDEDKILCKKFYKVLKHHNYNFVVVPIKEKIEDYETKIDKKIKQKLTSLNVKKEDPKKKIYKKIRFKQVKITLLLILQN